MIVRSARFLITRLLFLVMGLPITRYRKEVEKLWSLSEAGRAEELGQMLANNRPLNSAGVEVSRLEALTSSPPLSKKQLRAQRQNEQKKNGKSRFGRHTAGTTGEPTQVSLTREELARMLGVRDYCFRHYGLKLGEREARLWGRPEAGVKSWLKNFVLNRRVFHPVGPNVRDVVADLVRWQPDYIYGYTSLLLEAARVLNTMDLKIEPLKCVVCTAESILPSQKAYLSKAFKAPVVEEYGSTEFDVIAFECANGHRHLVNPWLIVEVCEEGVLISDLSRTSQDLIRYQLGDLLKIDSSKCQILGSELFVEQLQGRTLDRFFYLNEAEKVHASIFPQLFDRYLTETCDVFSFSLEQNSYSELDVSIDDTPSRGVINLEAFLERELRDLVGFDVSVHVLVIKSRTTSGKLNYFVQKIKH